MKLMKTMTFVLLTCFATGAAAQLQMFKDFEPGKEVFGMTTIRVKANMMGDYLEGLKETWIASNEVSKKLGQIEDYAVYMSELPASGDFNLVLVITFKDASDLEPNREATEAFMKAWGEKMQEKSREISKNYPSMRKITGEYRLREITFK